MAETVCPTCPGCGSQPHVVFGGGTQAFCPTDECETWTWNPTKPNGGARFLMVAHESDDGRSVIWKPEPLSVGGEAEAYDVEG